MWKTACLVLATSLIFPLLASRGAPPDGEEPVVSGQLPLASAGHPVTVELPGHPVGGQTQPIVWRQLENRTPVRQQTVCLAAEGDAGDSICDFGSQVTRMKPCLAAGDCPAARAWRQAMGQMGVRPAPQTMTRASVRRSLKIERPEREED